MTTYTVKLKKNNLNYDKYAVVYDKVKKIIDTDTYFRFQLEDSTLTRKFKKDTYYYETK